MGRGQQARDTFAAVVGNRRGSKRSHLPDEGPIVPSTTSVVANPYYPFVASGDGDMEATRKYNERLTALFKWLLEQQKAQNEGNVQAGKVQTLFSVNGADVVARGPLYYDPQASTFQAKADLDALALCGLGGTESGGWWRLSEPGGWHKDIRDTFLNDREFPSITSEAEADYCVTAQVRDAAQFKEKMDSAPDDAAPGFDSCKAPNEIEIEFYLPATSEADARAQFLDACNYVGQTASDIEIELDQYDLSLAVGKDVE